MDLTNLKIKDLKALIEKAKERISELEKSEATDVRNKLIAMARDAGFDAVELLSGKAAASASKVRRPAKPKYKHPTSGATWTGRGVKPVWIRELLASGRTLESLMI